MKRIVIIGMMASGKTTLAAKLSQCLQIPHVELDSFLWGSQWERTPSDEFNVIVEKYTRGDRWVAEIGRGLPLMWERADTLVWLDYSLWVIFKRLTQRNFRRIFLREKVWGRNSERWSAFITYYLVTLHRYRRHRKKFSKEIAQPQFSHLKVVRLRTPEETEHWLSDVAKVPD